MALSLPNVLTYARIAAVPALAAALFFVSGDQGRWLAFGICAKAVSVSRKNAVALGMYFLFIRKFIAGALR
jgi:phosphatidylglycerophosphate synthase